SLFAGALNPWAWMADPTVSLFLVFPLANAAMLLAPLLIFAFDDRAALVASLFLPCAILPWLLPKTLTGDLFIGFYCWNASFVAMSLSARLWTFRDEFEAIRHGYAK